MRNVPMEQVRELMQTAHWGAFATSDGERVGVRPMSAWAWVDGELWVATGDPSEKTEHLRKVPYAEYCFGLPNGYHVRIAGPVAISTSEDDKQTLWRSCEGLHLHVEDPNRPELVVLRMTPERIRLMNTPELVYWDIR